MGGGGGGGCGLRGCRLQFPVCHAALRMGWWIVELRIGSEIDPFKWISGLRGSSEEEGGGGVPGVGSWACK